MQRTRLILVIALSVLLAEATYAQVPALISHQGKLLGSNGQPVPDGAYAMEFRFYDACSAGNLLLTDSHAAVLSKDGIYGVLLGGGTLVSGTESKIMDVFKNHSSVCLGVRVGSDSEMVPRQPIVSAGFALHAAVSDSGALQSFLGDGSDGDVTIDSGSFSAGPILNNTLIRDGFFNNLTLTGGDLNTGGYRLFVKNTLTVAVGRRVERNGSSGGASVGVTAGAGAAAVTSGSVGGSLPGEIGAPGQVAGAFGSNGFPGVSGESQGHVLNAAGVAGGGGGSIPNNPSGGPGGGAGTKTDATSSPHDPTSATQMVDLAAAPGAYQSSSGSGSGGSGAAQGPGTSGAGGGSGSAGGVMMLAAQVIVNNGVISANGGQGGRGGDAVSGRSGGGGGGGGGSGGLIVLVYHSLSGSGTISVAGGVGGSGGAPIGDSPVPQPGFSGANGNLGRVIQIQL